MHPAKPGRGFDPLAYVARRVDAVEINSTLYRISDPTPMRRWIDRVTDHSAFRFTAVNAEIIRQGYGAAYTKYPFKYLDQFREREREAHDARRGLWGAK